MKYSITTIHRVKDTVDPTEFIQAQVESGNATWVIAWDKSVNESVMGYVIDTRPGHDLKYRVVATDGSTDDWKFVRPVPKTFFQKAVHYFRTSEIGVLNLILSVCTVLAIVAVLVFAPADRHTFLLLIICGLVGVFRNLAFAMKGMGF